MAVRILGSACSNDVETLMAEKQVTLHELDLAFHNCQAIVGLTLADVEVEADSDHSGIGSSNQMIYEVFPTETLEMSAIEFEHTWVCFVQAEDVHVAGLLARGLGKRVEHVRVLDAQPARLGAAKRRSQEVL